MTLEQVQIYEYCKKYLDGFDMWRRNMPIKSQHHGCGSTVPAIEHRLERIHRHMYERIETAMIDAENEVAEIIKAS